jgi:hypothetical protein
LRPFMRRSKLQILPVQGLSDQFRPCNFHFLHWHTDRASRRQAPPS